MSIWGPDVASYQGVGDWARVRAQGASFAFVKATQGITYINPSFLQNWHGIKAAGLVRGAYHFASLGDPVAEADHFCDTVAAAGGWEPGDGLVLDLETGSGDLNKWASLFLGRVHIRTGLPRALYSGAYFFTVHNLAGINAFRWVASYGSTPSIRFDLWQWTDRKALAGVGTEVVDCSSYAGTVDQLRAAFGYAAPAPAPTPVPAPAAPTTTSEADGMTIITRPDGSGYDALLRGVDNAVWHCWAASVTGLASEHPWESLGGQTYQTPTGVWESDMTRFAVFAIGTVAGELDRKLYDNAAGSWSDWTPLPGRAAK